MPQQCCTLPAPSVWCGVCVVRGHFAFASCGILRTSCRLSRHAKTCPRSSPTPPSPPLPPLLLSASFPAGEGGTKFCPHTRTSHCSCFAFQPAATCGKSGCISLFFAFLPYLPHSTPPTAATRSQLGLVIHTKRHELVVVTVVVAVVAVTVVAVVSVAAVADFLLACMRLVCNLIATRLCLGL